MNNTQRARLRGVIMLYNQDMTKGKWLSELGWAIKNLAEACGEQVTFDQDKMVIAAPYLLEAIHRENER